MLTNLAQDFRHSVRILLKNPTFTLVEFWRYAGGHYFQVFGIPL